MNRRMQLFVNEYLVSLNATDAARRAGYAPRHAGLRGYALLRRPGVQLAIRAAMDARAARTGVTADRIVEELAAIAFSDIRHIIDFGTNHVRLQPASTMRAADRAAIKSISVRIGRRGCGHVRVRLHDKFSALYMLERHLGMDRSAPLDPAARAKFAERIRGRLRRSFDRAARMREVGAIGRARKAAKRTAAV
ncbi:MAG TPA: terminase small subunit [Steroidobacteraceae bacterium]|nr:terminase small subunit [Steroidobacteraceae bacterium]